MRDTDKHIWCSVQLINFLRKTNEIGYRMKRTTEKFRKPNQRNVLDDTNLLSIFKAFFCCCSTVVARMGHFHVRWLSMELLYLSKLIVFVASVSMKLFLVFFLSLLSWSRCIWQLESTRFILLHLAFKQIIAVSLFPSPSMCTVCVCVLTGGMIEYKRINNTATKLFQ